MRIIFSLCILISIFSCKEESPKSQPISNSSHLDLSIEQNGKIIQPINGTITLDKVAFNLVFNFTEPNFILVNAAFNSGLMPNHLSDERPANQTQFTVGNIFTEAYFNTEKSIYVSNESSSAWLQESKDHHMFNHLDIKNGTYTATRVVENIFDLDNNHNTEIEYIDRPLYLVFVVIDGNKGLKNNKELQRITLKIEFTDDNSNAKKDVLLAKFNKLVDYLPLKNTPLTDSTNFDNTSINNSLNKKDAKLFQLGKIYPNFYTEGYHYKVSPSYKLNVSEKFKTIVFTIFKGDHEMESLLVNYDLEGELIASIVIAYDEIAEGFSYSVSTIKNNLIVKTNTIWIEEKEEEFVYFQINDDGTLTQLNLSDVILNQLNINKDDVHKDFFDIQYISNKISLVLIPKIAKQTYEDLVLDAYVLIIDTKTGEIKSKYEAKNCWQTDAIKINSIEANYNPYKIAENSETIGITVFYFNDNPVNPYNAIELTLLVRDNFILKPLLKDYEIYSLGGENDGDGNGVIFENTKTIDTEINKENVFYNLKVTNLNVEKKLIDYEEKIVETKETSSYLKYRNGQYIKPTDNKN